MKGKTLRLLSCLFLMNGWLWAEDFWEKKPYSEWMAKEVERILTKSPWGNQRVVGDTMVGGGPGPSMSGGGGGRGGGRSRGGDAGASAGELARSRSVSVRLHSAAPIRMALARRAQLSGNFGEQEAASFVQTHPAPGYIIIGLSVPGGRNRLALGDEEIEALKKKVYIELKQSKRRIRFERLVPPGPGRGGEAYLYFARTENGQDLFAPEERGFRFVADLDSRTRIRIQFDFKKMSYNGQLEI